MAKTNDRLVLKFLRGRSGKVDKGVEMFRKMLEWRKEFGADNAFNWSFPQIKEIKEYIRIFFNWLTIVPEFDRSR
jgi:hypothetical protein